MTLGLISSRVAKLSQRYNKNTCLTLVKQYTPLYEKGIKKTQNKSLETTTVMFFLSRYVNCDALITKLQFIAKLVNKNIIQKTKVIYLFANQNRSRWLQIV